jgi:hypothetical protein
MPSEPQLLSAANATNVGARVEPASGALLGLWCPLSGCSTLRLRRAMASEAPSA